MIERLKEILKRVELPVGVDGANDEWAAAEAHLNLRLPSDYRDFCLHYGTGHIRDSSILIDIWNPLSDVYGECIDQGLDSARRLSEGLNKDRFKVFDVYPSCPGLYPWGGDDLGNEFFWFTEGSPDEWRVVISDRGGIEYVETDLTMSGFLIKSMTHAITVGPFTQDGFFPILDDIRFERAQCC